VVEAWLKSDVDTVGIQFIRGRRVLSNEVHCLICCSGIMWFCDPNQYVNVFLHKKSYHQGTLGITVLGQAGIWKQVSRVVTDKVGLTIFTTFVRKKVGVSRKVDVIRP
jgi:hypothetical protein